VIRGDIAFSGRLHIDGTVEGNVTAEADGKAMLTLSSTGAIKGNVNVPYIILDGPVTGSVVAKEHIELAARAKVEGDVHYVLIEMAMGAEVNGKLVRVATTSAEPLQLKSAAREAG
jgi:cytoskeletal protein CcmA (bactofilin family)